MKRIPALALAAASVTLVPAAALAAESPWTVRVRVLDMRVDNGNSTTAVVPALGTVAVEDNTFPEVDISYAFSPHWAAELVLTYPQKHDVTFAGVDIGSVTQLPPTLTLQYHFIPDGMVRPYVGAGVNYTWLDPDLNAAPALGGTDAPLDLDGSSFGLAAQAGVDIRVARGWSVNLDAKYVQIAANDIHVSGGALAGTHVTDLDVDPWLLSVGASYQF